MEHPDMIFRATALHHEHRLREAERRTALLGRLAGPAEPLVAQACLFCRLAKGSDTERAPILKRAA